MLATVVVDVCPKADSPTLATSGARAFINRRWEWGLHTETAQPPLTVIKLVIADLPSVIVIVLGLEEAGSWREEDSQELMTWV